MKIRNARNVGKGVVTSIGAWAVAAAIASPLLAGDAQFVSSAGYRQSSDSPFASLGSLVVFNFEGGILPPGYGSIASTVTKGNSVDVDDGVIDGFGASSGMQLGSWVPFIPGGCTVGFSSQPKGYPTHAGVVVTAASADDLEGNPGPIQVTLTVALADGSVRSQSFDVLSLEGNATDDVFLGANSASGIASVSVSAAIPITIDHMQSAIGEAFVQDDVNSDGISDTGWFQNTWTAPGQHRAAFWLWDGDASPLGGWTSIDPAASSARMIALGDANGDKKADALWYDPASKRYTVWFMDGLSATSAQIARDSDDDWKPIGFTDMDGDMKADVVFRRSASGSTTLRVWILDGATVASEVSTTFPATYPMGYVGDVDADGRAEVLLRGATSGGAAPCFLTQLEGAAMTAPARIIGISGGTEPAVDASYAIAGLADLSGDGASDVVWRGPTGSVVTWDLDGGRISSKHVLSATAGNYWQIAGFPDLNGDGTRDVLFRGGQGETYVWVMNAMGIAQHFAGATVINAWKTPQVAR